MNRELEAALEAGPRACFIDATVRAGLIRPGDPINQAQVDFATDMVTLCSQIADRYPNPERTEDTIGDVDRGRLFEL
jgi:hypothetical protein